MATSIRYQRHSQQRGFALASILWLLAGLSVLVSGVSVSLLGVAQTNADSAKQLEYKLTEQSALADVTYLYATHSTLGAGAGVGGRVLMLDASVKYKVQSKLAGAALAASPAAWVTLQDEQGLLGLNSPSVDYLAALLPRCGATAQQRSALTDALMDYTDADRLKRLNGAEDFEYAAAGLPPPPNRYLQHPSELWRVLGWKALRDRWEAVGCDDSVSLRNNSRLNLYTAPANVLVAAGLSPEQASLALADRLAYRNRAALAPYLLNLIEEKYGMQGLMRFDSRSTGEVRVSVLSEDGWMRTYQLRRMYSDVGLPFAVSPWGGRKTLAPLADGLGATLVEDNLANFMSSTSASPTDNNAARPPASFN